MTLGASYKPLYRQIQEELTRRISRGYWKPAEMLPNEFALANELGVSQGSVRKALNGMVENQLLERRQGKGTFVAQHTPERIQFRFFRLARPGGVRVTPEGGEESVTTRAAKASDADHLGLARGEKVIEIRRTRRVDGAAAVFETIVVPEKMFPGLELYSPLPDAIYGIYQTVYGINIVSVVEEITAELASPEDADKLKVPNGSPILVVDRIAQSMDDTPVEWRNSRYLTGAYVYSIELR